MGPICSGAGSLGGGARSLLWDFFQSCLTSLPIVPHATINPRKNQFLCPKGSLGTIDQISAAVLCVCFVL